MNLNQIINQTEQAIVAAINGNGLAPAVNALILSNILGQVQIQVVNAIHAEPKQSEELPVETPAE